MANQFLRTRPTTTWAASTVYALGDRRRSTGTVPARGIHFEVTTAGTSGGAEPAWNTTVGGTTTDNTVVWTTRGSAAIWVASTAYVVGDRAVSTTAATESRRGRVFECTTAGTSGGAEPAWSVTVGATQADGTVTWTVRDYLTWDDAQINFFRCTGAASGALVAGDVLFVGDEHNETATLAFSFSPGGTTNPVQVICVNDTGDPALPTLTATTALIASASGIGGAFEGAAASFFGVNFSVGTGASSASLLFQQTSTNSTTTFENCNLTLDNTSTGSSIRFGAGSVTGTYTVRWRNVRLKFRSTSQAILLQGFGNLIWEDTPTALDTTGSIPAFLFTVLSGEGCNVVMRGVDTSALTGALTFNPGINRSTFLIQNCKIGTGALVGASLGTNNPVFNIVTSSNTGASINFVYKDGFGQIDEETTVVLPTGASDGTTNYSWRMVSNTVPNRGFPFITPPIVLWNDVVGVARTATVEIVRDNVTALTDNEIWLEVEYLGTSGSTRSSLVNDAVALLGTAAAQASSTAAWTTTGLTNPNKQKLAVTFTPQLKGAIRARVWLNRDSTTVFIDPSITLT